MNLIFLIHQEKGLGFSMIRFHRNLREGLEKKGHNVLTWGPKLYLSNNKPLKGLNKWLRYIDQYILFPIWFKFQLVKTPKNSLFVLLDQALGIWMPLIRKKPHIVHCHDFIALKSALGLVKKNKLKCSGRLYQKLILTGFRKANAFISVSKNTQSELKTFLNRNPLINKQVYNALDPQFNTSGFLNSRKYLSDLIKTDLNKGYILHVGGNTFYKNKIGVIEAYFAWRQMTKNPLPLLMIGSPPNEEIKILLKVSQYSNDIFFLKNVTEYTLVKSYQGASLLLFPSLMEGFGYPLIEAMACGCIVVTTDTAPMNEICEDVAFYVPLYNDKNQIEWALNTAKTIDIVVNISLFKKTEIINKGLVKIKKFRHEKIISEIENIYLEALSLYQIR